MIARRIGHDADRALRLGQLEESVGRPAELEAAAHLEALAFQPDLLPPNLCGEQRRQLGQSGDALGSVDDVLPRDATILG
jgi:hypothetical protein